jgi:hypothetical protein
MRVLALSLCATALLASCRRPCPVAPDPEPAPPPIIVHVREPCLSGPPPVPDYVEVPTCIAEPCPPLTAEAEAALERWVRAAESWMRINAARCAQSTAADPGTAPE